MVKFSLILPIILSSLYISFSLAQDSLSSCATNCSQTVGTTAGCVPGTLDQPTCVCTNAAFFGAASGCVWLSCTADEATTAESFWLGVCAAYKASLAGSTATVATSSNGYGPSSLVTSSSGTRTAYGGYSSVTSRSATSSNPYSATSPSVPGYGSSSAPSSNTAYGAGSSSTPSSSTSNLAATMPTHAAALFAGGIGAMVAVFV